MIWLVLGVVLWSAVHLVPSVAPDLRAALVRAVGENGYKGLFSVAIVVAIGLMIIGYRSAAPALPQHAGGAVILFGNLLVLVGFLLFGLSHAKTNVRRFVRHPQLTGIAFWAAGHLVAISDARALVLFGGLGLWALVSIPLINRRDGVWQKPEPVPLKAEIKPFAIGLAVYAVVFIAHPWLFGVSPLPG